MLEFIIIILPIIIAFLIYRKCYDKIYLKKITVCILFYLLIPNLLILIGLKCIGMQSFSLFEMSARFKIKWIALELALSILITWIAGNIRRLHPATVKQTALRVFPAALFLIVTYAIYTPSSLFLGNIDEFSLHYKDIIPTLLFMTLFLFAAIYFIAFCLLRKKALPFYIAFIFGIALSTYLQGNFLNPKLPILDGALIDWSGYRTERIISTLLWVLCIVGILALTYWKTEKTEKCVKYISSFISAVQLVSLVVLIITNPLKDTSSYGFSKEGEFSIGTDENIIIFIVDTLQASTMKEYLASEAYGRDGTLDDFTFFDNTVAGGAPTAVALPLFLTGMEYDPTQSYTDYKTEAWTETSLYDDLRQNGYDIRLYSEITAISNFPDTLFDNYIAIGDSWIDDYSAFSQSLYQLVNYLLMPQLLKERFWISTDTLLYTIQNVDYKIDDVYFHNDFLAADESLQTDYQKAFRLYHFNGVHPPYSMTEYFDRVWDFGVGEQKVLQGDMKIIYAYIEEMKRNGVYDASTIIIAGDHGQHTNDNPESNPALLIKLPQETHELAYNSAPAHFRYITATIAATVLDDYSVYGPAIYDITDDSDTERLHTIDDSIMERIKLKNYDESSEYIRLIISGDADALEYTVWNPHEINRIDYAIGDMIDFTADNEYADEINYRLYKENGAATASNELSVCFALTDYKKGDISLHFTYSNLYNDSQKIRLYANGNKVENIVCTRDDMGKEMTVVIPKEDITDNELIIRMVFPNAVTPNQLDRSNPDMRILSVAFDSMWLTQ
ncbi:MAG: sulfatase-like hydrolase/transferase [Clostridium sp.]|nr:sulfatase-like hydrolase/transferase [Clostridium sp.]